MSFSIFFFFPVYMFNWLFCFVLILTWADQRCWPMMHIYKITIAPRTHRALNISTFAQEWMLWWRTYVCTYTGYTIYLNAFYVYTARRRRYGRIFCSSNVLLFRAACVCVCVWTIRPTTTSAFLIWCTRGALRCIAGWCAARSAHGCRRRRACDDGRRGAEC